MSHLDEINKDKQSGKLGDEWKDWDGSIESAVNSGKLLFLILSGTILFFIYIVLLILGYLVTPRLNQWYHLLPELMWMAYALFIALSLTTFIQVVLTSTFEKNFFFSKEQGRLLFDLVFNKAFKISQIIGISRDRMGNSFVKVSNSISRALKDIKGEGRILVLLPRCLTKDTLTKIKQLKEKYPIDLYVVAGGEAARQKVKELDPVAVIGVACERDLVSGIRDVGTKLSVIGIPNQRPEGPCTNTSINLDELINAIEFYLEKK